MVLMKSLIFFSRWENVVLTASFIDILFGISILLFWDFIDGTKATIIFWILTIICMIGIILVPKRKISEYA